MAAVARRPFPTDASLREKLAQLLMVRIGSNMPPIRTVEEDESRVAALLQACPVGGLVLFNGSFADTPGVLGRLQQTSPFPLLIAADLERGAGQQLAGFPLVPHAMALQALGPRAADAARRFGRLTAEAGRLAGVHMPFAPVADVNSDPRNPIIATRAFGSDPARVAELVAAFIEGCLEGGALPTAKHFPGHGNTHVDSHHALPTVSDPRAELAARDWPPFVAAIRAGAPLIMTAHVSYPALDPSGQPATLSHPILTGLLRQELGFAGAVVSDSFLMEGVKSGADDEGERAVQAIAAGVDMLVDLAEPVATLDALESAVHAGRLSLDRIDEALARVLRLKQQAFSQHANASEDELRGLTSKLALEVARGAVVVMKNDGALPLDPAKSLSAVLINPFPRPANAAPPPLGELLSQRFSRLNYLELGESPSPEELKRAARAAGAAEQTLVAFVVKPAAWRHFGLPAWATQWILELAEKRAVVAACLGAPQGLEPLSAAAVHICTFSDVPASQQALVEKLLA